MQKLSTTLYSVLAQCIFPIFICAVDGVVGNARAWFEDILSFCFPDAKHGIRLLGGKKAPLALSSLLQEERNLESIHLDGLATHRVPLCNGKMRVSSHLLLSFIVFMNPRIITSASLDSSLISVTDLDCGS